MRETGGENTGDEERGIHGRGNTNRKQATTITEIFYRETDKKENREVHKKLYIELQQQSMYVENVTMWKDHLIGKIAIFYGKN